MSTLKNRASIIVVQTVLAIRPKFTLWVPNESTVNKRLSYVRFFTWCTGSSWSPTVFSPTILPGLMASRESRTRHLHAVLRRMKTLLPFDHRPISPLTCILLLCITLVVPHCTITLVTIGCFQLGMIVFPNHCQCEWFHRWKFRMWSSRETLFFYSKFRRLHWIHTF